MEVGVLCVPEGTARCDAGSAVCRRINNREGGVLARGKVSGRSRCSDGCAVVGKREGEMACVGHRRWVLRAVGG